MQQLYVIIKCAISPIRFVRDVILNKTWNTLCLQVKEKQLKSDINRHFMYIRIVCEYTQRTSHIIVRVHVKFTQIIFSLMEQKQ